MAADGPKLRWEPAKCCRMRSDPSIRRMAEDAGCCAQPGVSPVSVGDGLPDEGPRQGRKRTSATGSIEQRILRIHSYITIVARCHDIQSLIYFAYMRDYAPGDGSAYLS